MAASDRTKLLLANGLKELSEAKPFHKIRVSELCQRCGVDRRTFYYHFRDVYDLAAWIFKRTMEGIHPDTRGRYTTDSIAAMMTGFKEDHVFYRRALAEDSQNALGRYVIASTVKMYEQGLKTLWNRDTLSSEERFAVRFFCVGAMVMLRDWIFADCLPAEDEMVQRLASVMPPVLRELYDFEGKGEAENEG